MNTVEKLEQSGIVKEKGTQYFKVCRVVFTTDLFIYLVLIEKVILFNVFFSQIH